MRLQALPKRALDPVYLFGRFHSVRAAYSALRGLGGRVPGIGRPSSLFAGVDIPTAVDEIKREAVFLGLKLRKPLVDEIVAFAKAAPLHPVGDRNGETFKYEEVIDGRCGDGRLVPIGGVPDPENCAAVREIIRDPVIRQIVSCYLGYQPRKRVTILDWSFATEFSSQECRGLNYKVIDYHYDVNGFNFVHVYFYLTDTDRMSGAHVMMRKSHNRKPLRMLLGRTSASEEAVWKEYGQENELIIEGAAGTGFVQDASCFHRASPARTGDRLMLAVRFS